MRQRQKRVFSLKTHTLDFGPIPCFRFLHRLTGAAWQALCRVKRCDKRARLRQERLTAIYPALGLWRASRGGLYCGGWGSLRFSQPTAQTCRRPAVPWSPELSGSGDPWQPRPWRCGSLCQEPISRRRRASWLPTCSSAGPAKPFAWLRLGWQWRSAALCRLLRTAEPLDPTCLVATSRLSPWVDQTNASPSPMVSIQGFGAHSRAPHPTTRTHRCPTIRNRFCPPFPPARSTTSPLRRIGWAQGRWAAGLGTQLSRRWTASPASPITAPVMGAWLREALPVGALPDVFVPLPNWAACVHQSPPSLQQ